MEITVRQAKADDAQQMLQVYNSFSRQFVGSALRTVKSYRSMLRGKNNINWVALDNHSQIVGYVYARLDKQQNLGEFREIVVDPNHDFEKLANPMIEKINEVFMKKKVSAISAYLVRNPAIARLFLKLGFFESETTDVFMYAILNVQKFLNEFSPVFINRLKQLRKWKSLTQIECEGYSLFLEKRGESVQQIVWTNQPINFKISMTRELLTKLVFGTAGAFESHLAGQLRVETTESSEKANQLLKALFPRIQFLIMDYW